MNYGTAVGVELWASTDYNKIAGHILMSVITFYEANDHKWNYNFFSFNPRLIFFFFFRFTFLYRLTITSYVRWCVRENNIMRRISIILLDSNWNSIVLQNVSNRPCVKTSKHSKVCRYPFLYRSSVRKFNDDNGTSQNWVRMEMKWWGNGHCKKIRNIIKLD